MLSVLIIVALGAIVSLAAGASGTASQNTRARDSVRRERHLARHPDEVNSGDIRRMLSEAEVPSDDVSKTMSGAAELGYTPFTMLAWIKKFDAHTLAHVIGV